MLGFEIVAASDEVETPEGRFSHWMWLRLGPAEIMLNTAYDEGERPDARVEARQGWHGDICLYFGCPDVDAVYDALRTRLPDLKPACPLFRPIAKFHDLVCKMLGSERGYGRPLKAPCKKREELASGSPTMKVEIPG